MPPGAPAPLELAFDLTVRGHLLEIELDAKRPLGVSRLGLLDESAGDLLDVTAEVPGGGARPLAEVAGGFIVPRDVPLRIHYRVDLDRLLAHESPDRVMSIGADVLADSASWLLLPTPLPDGTSARLHVLFAGGDLTDLWTPWPVAPLEAAAFSLDTHALSVGGPVLFGPLEQHTIVVPGGTLAVTLAKASHRAPTEDVLDWITRSARADANELYGTFPVGFARVLVLPVRSDEPAPFGQTIVAGIPAVMLELGDQAPGASLAFDWVGVHELFHLGNPPWRTRIDWFEEGITTYYTEVVRARAGWFSPLVAWSHLAVGLQYARSGHGTPLASATSFLHEYWGGALFALATDLTIRERTQNRASLDRALRELWRRAQDGRTYTLDEIFAELDVVAGAPVAQDLYNRYVLSPAPPPAEALLDELGVRPLAPLPSKVDLRATDVLVSFVAAPESDLRDAIMRARAPSPNGQGDER